MKLVVVVDSFIAVVDKLLKARSPTGGKFFVETKGGRYLNFKPKQFKIVLGDVVGKDSLKSCLVYYKRLGFIVVDEENRFTNIQWIKKKSQRVITVDKEVYETLKELRKEGD
ncbi:MAG: hypothetical protein PWQ37_2348 [Candidatus Petromonas sp.]|jgi:hypothetical protein|nr:hypothetical protein [Candidatus Petromonas sp.]